MKRSEMLDLIEAALLENWRIDGCVGGAEDILDLLEDQDMLPPGKEELEHVSPSIAYYYYYDTKNGWEPEDD